MCSTVGVTQNHGLKYPDYILAHLWWFSIQFETLATVYKN